MKRNLLLAGILALVALLVWPAGKVRVPVAAPAALASARPPEPTETPGPPTPCAACVQAALAALAQEAINLDVRQTQATAAADVPSSPALVTSIAAAATQSAAQTPAMLNANVFWAQGADPPRQWQADTLATASAANVTQSAVQTEAGLQQARLQRTSGAATQNAKAAAAQQKMDQTVSGTAAVIAVTGLEAQSNITPRLEPGTVLWMWLTPIFILGAAVLSLWGGSRWLAQRRTGG